MFAHNVVLFTVAHTQAAKLALDLLDASSGEEEEDVVMADADMEGDEDVEEDEDVSSATASREHSKGYNRTQKDVKVRRC